MSHLIYTFAVKSLELLQARKTEANYLYSTKTPRQPPKAGTSLRSQYGRDHKIFSWCGEVW